MSPVLVGAAGQDKPLSTERQEDQRAAWVELFEAAKGSKVASFHACTRTGWLWTEDPAAVRAAAATVREFPDTDSQRT